MDLNQLLELLTQQEEDFKSPDPLDDLSIAHAVGFHGLELSILPNFKNLESLLGAIFGKIKDEPFLGVGPEQVMSLAEAVGSVLATLSPREETVIRLRFGLYPNATYTR